MGFSLPEPELSDGVVRLRPIDARDLGVVEQAVQLAEIAGRFGLADADAARYVAGYEKAWVEGTAAAFAICETDDDAVGQVLLEVREAGRADVGYWLVRKARGRGLATRALRLLSGWALAQPGISRLQLWTSPENVASARVAERSGFRREGVLRSYGVRDDGTRVDAVFFSLLPEDL